ncbi:MAG: hypothetical protein WD151_15125 [Phycisphaeraceae bacterium]
MTWASPFAFIAYGWGYGFVMAMTLHFVAVYLGGHKWFAGRLGG